ncbi:hypothetical protein LAZ67_6002603 [Cordylochernes scorpioides]|uniref:Mos1 transposase HTH domain-containing protein n=1 Tax=Cordylochernes scorpioides TaxID=51811 RepID=A0ABY6KJX0_9ARAC|nr:hypothetical protein LAZ67_6002603 [Cordylochernes scorpioides]
MEDQRICIKFCVKNGFKGAEFFWMLQTAYGDAVMRRRRVFEWYKRFKEGREETADNECSGRPSTSTTPGKVDKVLELVREDRRITAKEVAEEAGISFGSTQSIMKDILGVRRLNAVLVPKDLTFDQKNARKETASLNLEETTDGPELLKRASEWRFKNESRTKKARKAPSRVKVMLTVFFEYQGIVHHEFQQQGSTITADSYLGVLRSLRLKGISPDLGSLDKEPIMIKNESGETSSQVPSTYLSLQQPRCPSSFAGDGSQDAQKWLKDYKRVVKYNRWDHTMCLANSVFFLEGTARKWFENNEETLTSWDDFQRALGEAFGQQEEVIKEAESLLKNRAQKVKESSETYIQDVLYLCQVVNPRMDDETKLGHLMKGVAEDILSDIDCERC